MDQAAYLKGQDTIWSRFSKYREEAQYPEEFEAYQQARLTYDQAQNRYVNDKAAYDQAKSDKDQAAYEAGLAEKQKLRKMKRATSLNQWGKA